MTDQRRLLFALVVGFALLAAAALWDVLGTVFFAITVVFVADPVYGRLRERGLSPWWASAATTTLVFAVVVALLAPFVFVVYSRGSAVIRFLGTLSPVYVVEVAGYEYAVRVATVFEMARGFVSSLAVRLAAAAPVLGVKLTVFAMVVFALLVRKPATAAALRSAVPAPYREVVDALSRRTRQTLVALYVLQAATAGATFVVALVVFTVFGYDAPVVLAFLSGALQFLPIVGPSVVIATLVGYELVVGSVVKAVALGVVGWLLVAWLPDLVIRPRLAERTAHFPGSLYFVGFAGGVLTMGTIGVIAGPVAVALLFQSLQLLADETTDREGSLPDDG